MHLNIPLLMPEVWDCQILNQVVESQFFNSLWDRYHQWLYDTKLIQISAFSASYFRINPCFTAGRRIGVWIVTQLVATGKTTKFKSIVYGASTPLIPLKLITNTQEANYAYLPCCHRQVVRLKFRVLRRFLSPVSCMSRSYSSRFLHSHILVGVGIIVVKNNNIHVRCLAVWRICRTMLEESTVGVWWEDNNVFLD